MEAVDVDDPRQIVGYRMHEGRYSGFLLTPTEVAVPGAVWMFGSGLLGSWGATRRRRG